MSAFSLYDISVPRLVQILQSALFILNKGEQHAREHNIDTKTLFDTGLAPDQKPLAFQVQMLVWLSYTLLTKVASPPVAISEPDIATDKPETFETMQSRLASVLAELRKVSRAALSDDRAEAEIVIALPNRIELKFDGLKTVQGFIIPNAFFHLTTAYGILRNRGIPLGKRDYLDPFLAALPPPLSSTH